MKKLIFSIIYYLLVTPVGLISRVFGVNFIEKGFDSNSKTYWNKKENSERLDKKYYKSQS